MARSPYLLWVNSRPTQVDDDLWIKWYIEEHVPDLVGHHASTRASFYQELSPDQAGEFKLGGDPHPRKYLAVYQTDFEEPLKHNEYMEIRKTSEMWPKNKENGANGEFNARNYKLIQDYDPEKIGLSGVPRLINSTPFQVADIEK